jgi:hypothetical protein
VTGTPIHHAARWTRIAGEASMFNVQRVGSDREPLGMNAPGAEANYQFVLNVLHWLTGKL